MHGDKVKLTRDVCEGILKYSRSSKIVQTATGAFLTLTNAKGIDSWIGGTEIFTQAGLNKFKNNRHYGLWPWMEITGAGVIQEQVNNSNKWVDTCNMQIPYNSNTRYKVKKEFYNDLFAECKLTRGW